jgi:inosose dehydratase
VNILDRFAGAPISWGICEVPGWGKMLDVERVLAEMVEMSMLATELGSPGFLPDDPAAVSELCQRYGLGMIGGFVPLVLHDADVAEENLADAHRIARHLAACGGDKFITAVVVDPGWGPRYELSAGQWNHMFEMLHRVDDIVAEYGMTQAIHPHVNTFVETADDVRRVLDGCTSGWTMDTGHLLIGGYDPVQFALDAGDRVKHVHLKDVYWPTAEELLCGTTTLMGAVQAGMFVPLGQGGAKISESIATLEARGYAGWYVLEQDAAITGDEPPAGTGPIDDVRESVVFLRELAHASVSGD